MFIFIKKHPMRIVLIITLLMSTCLSAQIVIPGITGEAEYNYIPNPGFEETTNIPCFWNQGKSQMAKWFKDWSSPTATTPDLLSTQGKSTCWSHPKKHNEGKQYPHSGTNMMGIKIFGLGGTETFWHEYLQIPLKDELKADSLYFVSMWVNLSARASRATNNIGIAMLDEPMHSKNRLPLYITPVVNQDKIIKKRIVGWKKIKGVFKATGEEKALVIGNFYGDDETISEKIPGGRDGAYYYIDDIVLRKARPNESETPKPKESVAPAPPEVVEGRIESDEIVINKVEYEVGTTIELNNIFFEFDKAELLSESKHELSKLRDLLFDYPYMEIEIAGHTDDIGRSDYNLELSHKRAKAVFNYLIINEIDMERLSYIGFGNSKPIADNSTEEGREKNRRVEFKVVKQ